jgi:hypothetical protein
LASSSLAIGERTYPANSAESVSAYIARLFCVVDVFESGGQLSIRRQSSNDVFLLISEANVPICNLVVLRGSCIALICPSLRKAKELPHFNYVCTGPMGAGKIEILFLHTLWYPRFTTRFMLHFKF